MGYDYISAGRSKDEIRSPYPVLAITAAAKVEIRMRCILLMLLQ